MPIIAVDTETTGLNSFLGDRPFGISICNEEYKSSYIDFPITPNREVILPVNFIFCEYCVNDLESPYIDKVFWNAKFDILMLESIGIKVKGRIHDAMFAARCCNTDEHTYELKKLAYKYFDIAFTDEENLKEATRCARAAAKNKDGYKLAKAVEADYWLPKHFNSTCKLAEIYCNKDTFRTMKLWKFYEQGMKELGTRKTYDKEMALLLEVVLPAERTGVYAHREVIKRNIVFLYQRKTEIEKELAPLNPNSTQQVVKALMAKGIPLKEETDKGNIKCDQRILKEFRQYPIVNKLLEHSGISTGYGYFVNYANALTEEDVIHANLKQSGAKTWRFACSDPNLLNISNDETSGGEFVVNGRIAFGPRPGYVWYTCDYSQIELRIFAHRAGGKLLDAFIEGRDPHNETRMLVPFLAAKPKDIGRKLAKNTNFTLINVGGPKVLNQKYSMPMGEAIQIHGGFHAAYPEVKKRQYEIANYARQNGFIFNAFNDKIAVDPDKAYTATAMDVQSSAARLIKNAMLSLTRWFKQENIAAQILLCVHDELVIEVANWSDCPEVTESIKYIMEDHHGAFSIPTPVEIKLVMEHWGKKEAVNL